MTQLVPVTAQVPTLVKSAGERAQTRFWEFFVSNIRNPHTRRAYGRSIGEFLAWCERRGPAATTGPIVPYGNDETVGTQPYVHNKEVCACGA
jgi:hypothetical protein